MKIKFLTAIGISFIAVLTMTAFQYGYGSKSHSEQKDDIEEVESLIHSNHNHVVQDNDKDIDFESFKEISLRACEHKIPIYQCHECRYEIGMVKLTNLMPNGTAKKDEKLMNTVIVKRQTVSHGLNVTGEIGLNKNSTVHVTPRIPGIIESVYVDVGTNLDNGSILFKIFSAEVGKALSEYQKSLALTALSKKNFERENALFERRIASEQDMVEAKMIYEQHRTELTAAEQALHVLGITEAEMSNLIKNTQGKTAHSLTVRAPISGVVIEKHAVAGELVEPGEDVIIISDLSSVWAWADIYEQDLSRLLKAQNEGPIPVKISVRAFPDLTFTGTIDYISSIMNEQTRTIKVRATIENADFYLRPGMFCEINIRMGNGEEVLAVPHDALLSDEGNNFVFAHYKEDYFVQRFVTLGRDFFDRVEILEGLKPGEMIVSEGAFLLKSDVLREKMGAGCAD